MQIATERTAEGKSLVAFEHCCWSNAYKRGATLSFSSQYYSTLADQAFEINLHTRKSCVDYRACSGMRARAMLCSISNFHFVLCLVITVWGVEPDVITRKSGLEAQVNVVCHKTKLI